MTGGLNRLLQLNPVAYKWKSDNSDGEGFIAHELQSIVPNAVSGKKDDVDEEGNPKYQGVDLSRIVPLLVASLQELKAENDALKARIEALETK